MGLPARRRWLALRPYLLPVVLLLAFSLPHLDQGDFRTDTARYAAVGMQAWDDGELLTLRTAPGEGYFKKPPLVFWVHGAVLATFGVSLEAARLPTVFAAAVCVLGTVWLVRGFHGRGVALASGVVLATTYEFFRRTREISLDMWQLAFFVLAMGMLARASGKRWWAWALGGGACIGLALMTKPFVGLLGLGLIGVWILIRPGRAMGAATLGVALKAAVVVAAPWHVAMVVMHGRAFIDVYVFGEVVDRAAGEIARDPWWGYLAMLGQTYWPWLAALVGGLWVLVATGRLGRSGLVDRGGPLLAVIWFGVWLGLISAFPDKAPRYALVLWPAGAWIAGGFLAAGPLQGGRRLVRTILEPGVALIAIAACVLAALPISVQAPPEPGWAEALAAVERALAESGGEAVVIGVGDNDQARFVLAGLEWPREVWGEDFDGLAVGTVIVRGGGAAEGVTEREDVIASPAPLVITRVVH